MARIISRRSFARASLLGVGGAALAACAPAAAPPAANETVVASETVVVEGAATAKAPTEAVKLTYGFWGDEIREGQFTKLAEACMEALPGVQVELQRKPWGQYWESLEVQVAGGISPDLSFMTPEYLYHFWKAGVILDLTDLVQRDALNLSDWVGDAGEGRIQGRQVAMPYTNGIEILYYNADMFDAAGLDYPSKEWTWDEMRLAADALTKGEGDAQQWGMWINNSTEQGWGPLSLGNRGWPFTGAIYTDDGGYFDASGEIKAVLDSPEMVEALTWWIANICELSLQPSPATYAAPPGIDYPFQSGQIGMYIGGTFDSPSIAQSPFKWDVSYIPRSPKTKELRSPSFAIPNIAFKTTKYPEESWQALKWYSGETAQNMLVELNMKEPTLKSALAQLSGPAPAFGSVVLDTYLNFAWNMSTVVFDNVNEATAAIESALDRAYLCEVGLDQAVAEGNAAANSALSQA